MKLYLVLALSLCALAAAAPSEKALPSVAGLQNEVVRAEERNFLVNALIRQLFTFLRYIINNGSGVLNIPPLDPLEIDSFDFKLPAGIINLDLKLKKIHMIGLGGFEVKKSNLDLNAMTFDLEVSVPKIDIGAEEYDLVGDLYTAIPLFGKGKAHFLVDNFTFSAKVFLKQSEDKKSILIDRIENATYDIPAVKSMLTGVIGGGSIDAVVNAITEDVIVNYINRFQAAIASVTSDLVVKFGNPILDTLDTWRYIAPLLPRPRD